METLQTDELKRRLNILYPFKFGWNVTRGGPLTQTDGGRGAGGLMVAVLHQFVMHTKHKYTLWATHTDQGEVNSEHCAFM